MKDAELTPAHGDCGARRRNGGTCEKPAGWGTPHVGTGSCRLHGGNTPNHITAGQRVLAAKAVNTYGEPRDIGPVQAMAELLHNSAGHVAWLLENIRAQDPDALVWGIADEVDKGSGEFPGVDVRQAAAPSVWLQQYDKERRLLLDISRDLARLGIDWTAREAVRQQGAALARVMRETARRLGHDPQDPTVTAAFRAALRQVIGGGTDPDRIVDGNLA